MGRAVGAMDERSRVVPQALREWRRERPLVQLGLGALEFSRDEFVDKGAGTQTGGQGGELGPRHGVLGIGRGEIRGLLVGRIDKDTLVRGDDHVGDLTLFQLFEHTQHRVVSLLGRLAGGEGRQQLGFEGDGMDLAGGGGGLGKRVAGLQTGFERELE